MKGDEELKKKILTIDDLVRFCQDQNFTQFNSKDSGYSVHVQVPCEIFEVSEDEDPLTFYGNVKLMHTGRNRNKSNLTEKGAKSCLSKIAYKPVLADFTEVNGERDFTYHAMEFNDDGSRTYIEKQVGCFTSDKPYMKQDPDHEDRQYIYAKVAIPREYTDAAEIIERKGGTKVSAELCINEMSYSVEDGLLLEDVDVMGVTLLGTDPDTGEEVQEGMQGAYLQIEDFSADNNSVVNKAQLKEEIISEVLNRIDYKLADNTSPYNVRKEEQVGKMDNENVNVFEETEVEAEAKVTAEEATVETTEEENIPVVETEASKEEATDETADVTPDEVVDEGSSEEFADDPDEEDESDEAEDHQSVSAIEDEDSTGTKVENSLNYSVTINGVKKDFSVSLIGKLTALSELVNATYGEVDNTWFDVDAFEEDKLVLFHDYWNNKHWRQSYKVKSDVYSLVGDRIEVFCTYMSADEQKKFEQMKANYSSIESELNAYKSAELHSKREEILNAEDYSVMADYAEFAELKSNMDNYSTEDLAKEADLLFAKFMKSNRETFAAKGNAATKGMVFMSSGAQSEEEKLPYGGLFKNFKRNKN